MSHQRHIKRQPHVKSRSQTEPQQKRSPDLPTPVAIQHVLTSSQLRSMLPDTLRTMQRTYGNQAVSRMVQRQPQDEPNKIMDAPVVNVDTGNPMSQESIDNEVDVKLDMDEDDKPETHILRIDDDGNVIIHSDPIPLETYITKKGLVDASLIKWTTQIKQLWKGTMSGTKGNQIAVLLQQIASRLVTLGINKGAVPPSSADFHTRQITAPGTSGNTVRETVTDSVDAILSVNPGNLEGSSPNSSSTPYTAELRQFAGYKRGHMLNHKVHGPGEDKNLVPISTQMNKDMERGVEKKLKELVLAQRRVVRYTVRIKGWGSYQGGRQSAVEQQLPTNFEFKIERLKPKPNTDRRQPTNWTETTKAETFPFNMPHAHPNDTTNKFDPKGTPTKSLPYGKILIDKSNYIEKQLNRPDGRTDVWQVNGLLVVKPISGMTMPSEKPLYDYELLKESPKSIVEVNGNEIHVYNDSKRRKGYKKTWTVQQGAETELQKKLHILLDGLSIRYAEVNNQLQAMKTLHKKVTDALRFVQQGFEGEAESYVDELAQVIKEYNQNDFLKKQNDLNADELRAKIEVWVGQGEADRTKQMENPPPSYDEIEKAQGEWETEKNAIELIIKTWEKEYDRIGDKRKVLDQSFNKLKNEYVKRVPTVLPVIQTPQPHVKTNTPSKDRFANINLDDVDLSSLKTQPNDTAMQDVNEAEEEKSSRKRKQSEVGGNGKKHLKTLQTTATALMNHELWGYIVDKYHVKMKPINDQNISKALGKNDLVMHVAKGMCGSSTGSIQIVELIKDIKKARGSEVAASFAEKIAEMWIVQQPNKKGEIENFRGAAR